MSTDKKRPVLFKAKSFQEAEEWDILQQVNMTPEERQKIALELKRRVFGKKNRDVREYYKHK